ncbi:RNA-directed RNA polymerase L [Rhizoctonia solani]|uniref:RNA-directed RNA polymerase L n=1 Tax=Rhizoctonia solani TaxID=456999 RepID=A0A8H7HJA5_9AGAM|nr:RNA-directed RNA polymerase L [Rhizoctonia solani]KAF8686048.1 hypothetical protein RHS04_00399 [Rhizoctonia solani]QRW23718.1 RNA-directed RNA polymerase L [Rhizoctonia solani]
MGLHKDNLLITSANRLGRYSGSKEHSSDPHQIDYSGGWRSGPTEEWYMEQPSTKFTKLEYRKMRDGWKHEYIVVELDNGTVCRFDRQGKREVWANGLTVEGLDASDTAHVIRKDDEKYYPPIINESEVVLRMHFPDGQDILTILGICYGIQRDGETEHYSLFRYNCYFFSWTIVTALARRTVDWALLGSNAKLWDELVKTTMAGINSDESRLDRLKSSTRSMFGKKSNAPIPPSSGSAYLLSTLQIALSHTRSNVKKNLTESLLKSTVEKNILEITEKSSKSAAEDAARSHASQAARDASFEAVIEVMWGTLLSEQDGIQLWEDRCKRTEDCVRKASAAAADAALTFPLTPPATPPVSGDLGSATASIREAWEDAWDDTWNQNWLVKSKTKPATSRIALLAKAAWSKAWKDATLANEIYVPLVSNGVATYVMNHLPEAVIKIDKTAPGAVKRMVKSLTSSDTSHSELQRFIQARISEFVNRLSHVPTAGVTSEIIEESMTRIWVTVTQLEDLAFSTP